MDKLKWYYLRIGGIFSVRAVKVWAKIHRKPVYDIRLKRLIDSKEPTVLVSNHQTMLDPPGVFAALPFDTLLTISPVKFMTWHKYYNSKYKLPLYTTGCFPSHGDGLTGVEGAVYFANNGYRTFIFPEGKRIKDGVRTPAYDGVVKVLERLPEARLILVHIDWEPRKNFFSRPSLSVTFSDAPDSLNRSSADAIMDAIYKIKKVVD